jgi:hypothetical protein
MTRNPNLKKHAFRILLITILGSNLSTPNLVSAAKPMPKEVKAPCRLEVADAHISKNMLKKEGKLAVKVVFKSICNLDQENLTIKVQIVKKGFFGSQSVTPIIVRKYPFVKANRWVLIKNIYAYCETTKSTYFSGTAEAQAYVNGTQVFAPRAQSEKSTPIECGT